MIVFSGPLANHTRWVVLISGFVTSLFVWLPLNDPVQQPKALLLLFPAAWLLSLIAIHLTNSRVKQWPFVFWAYFLFTVGILVTALVTDVRYTAFFGDFLRSMGALSYLCLAIVGMATVMSFDFSHLKELRNVLLLLGAILSAYGLLQAWGHDPAHFQSAFSPVIGTLGNPDFISGLLGILAIAALWVVFSLEKIPLKIVIFILFLIELFVIKKTASSQGFLVVAIGVAFLVTALLWEKKKVFGQASLATFAVFLLLVFLGLVDKGPLASRIYRGTLQNRFDYWHSAISMGKAHLFTGVGLERFGDSYFQYAPLLRTSQTQQTNNAHNLLLQFFATGGIVLLIPYILLILTIAWVSLRALVISKGTARIDLVALFSMWVGLLLVSLISIDNLGETIWFWIIGGVLCGIAYKEKVISGDSSQQDSLGMAKSKSGKKAKTSKNFIYPRRTWIISIVLVGCAFYTAMPQFQLSSQLDNLRHNKSKLDRVGYVARINAVAESRLSNNQALIVLTNLALVIEERDLAIALAKKIIASDPRSFPASILGAQASNGLKYEKENNFFLERLVVLEPTRVENLLKLLKNYLILEQFANVKETNIRIQNIAPNSQEAKIATALIDQMKAG